MMSGSTISLRTLEKERGRVQGAETCLDVGCGGGFLAEEFAKAGFRVTGVDPVVESLETARAHASSSGLSIEYRVGKGRSAPVSRWVLRPRFVLAMCSNTYGMSQRCVGEISRVLKPGGFFFHDTINRNLRELGYRHQGNAGLAGHRVCRAEFSRVGLLHHAPMN